MAPMKYEVFFEGNRRASVLKGTVDKGARVAFFHADGCHLAAWIAIGRQTTRLTVFDLYDRFKLVAAEISLDATAVRTVALAAAVQNAKQRYDSD